MFTYISSYFWYALGYTENSKDSEMEILKDKVNKLEELIENIQNKTHGKKHRNRKKKLSAKERKEFDNINFKKLSDNQIKRLASNEVYSLEIIDV